MLLNHALDHGEYSVKQKQEMTDIHHLLIAASIRHTLGMMVSRGLQLPVYGALIAEWHSIKCSDEPFHSFAHIYLVAFRAARWQRLES
jgi:hypothetical protein